jgi:hypothetical protein
MGTPTVTLAAGVMAGGPAAAFVTTNSRAKSQAGFLGLQTDIVQFAGPMVTGTWITAAARVKVNQVPVVLQSSSGTAVSPAPASAPMSVSTGDARVMGS